jgi:hypothetical protein
MLIRPHKFQRNETYLQICLIVLVIFVGINTSIKTPIMGDEALTLFLGTLPSLSDLYAGLKLGADSHGPLYHTINWYCQTAILGSELENLENLENIEIYSRLPSIIFFCISLSLIFSLLSKKLPMCLAFFLTLTPLYWAETLRHIAEIRSYSFLFLLVVLGYISIANYMDTKKRKYIFYFGACICLGSLSHPLAPLYIGALGSTYLVSKYLETRKIDTHLIITMSISVVPYVLWLALAKHQVSSTMSKGTSWAEAPTITDLFEFTNPTIPMLLTFGLGFFATRKKKIFRLSNFPLWAGMSFILIAMGLWIASQFTNPLFLERYLWPLRFGWILIALGVLSSYTFSGKLKPIIAIASTILIALIMNQTNPTRVTTGGFWSENPWLEAGFGDSKYFSEDIPILCESSTTYLPRKMYLGDIKNYILLLVPPKDDLKTPSPRGIDYLMSKALKQTDKRQNILDPKEILENHKRFYLLNETFLDSDTYTFPNSSYKRTLLNPSREDKNQTLRIELIEKITN